MAAHDSYLTLKDFFESRRSARQAMNAIKEGVEIGVVIGGSHDCALFRQGENPVVEERPATNPDVVFHIRPEALEVIATKTKDEIGDVGVNVLKEILAGSIQVKVPGKILNLMSRGYLDMLRAGGAPVMALLARNGLASVTKIMSSIRKMKS